MSSLLYPLPPIGSEPIKAYACSNYEIGRCGGKNSIRRPVDLVNKTVLDWLLVNVLREETASLVVDELERKLVAKAKADGGNRPALEREAARIRRRVENLTEALADAPSDLPTSLYSKLRDEKTALAFIEQLARRLLFANNCSNSALTPSADLPSSAKPSRTPPPSPVGSSQRPSQTASSLRRSLKEIDADSGSPERPASASFSLRIPVDQPVPLSGRPRRDSANPQPQFLGVSDEHLAFNVVARC